MLHSLERVNKIFRPVTLLVITCLLSACQSSRALRQEVVVYTSVDQVYAEPVLQAFEEASGIRVLAVYDVEATKTVGLAQRLLAEKGNPQADVFWSGEFTQTMFLNEQGVLAQYRTPTATGLPSGYMDPQGYWYAFGGRARVILVNTNLVRPGEEPPQFMTCWQSVTPAANWAWQPVIWHDFHPGGGVICAEWCRCLPCIFQKIAQRGVQVVDGNSVVREMVANGHWRA